MLILLPHKAQRSSVLIINISHIVGHKDSRLRKIVQNWQESSPQKGHSKLQSQMVVVIV